MISTENLAPPQLVPKMKRGYDTIPDFVSLNRMTEFELQNVRESRILNGFGSIHWPGNTDLTEVDLEECVNI